MSDTCQLNTYENRVAAWEKKNQPVEATKKPKKRLSKKQKALQENPYYRARNDLLESFEEWKTKRILRYESEGNTDDASYYDFIKRVAKLGDKYSDEDLAKN